MREIRDLSELKEIELNIMKTVHEFCETHDIQYFLAYGTLLGAIRHKGFIPWDDDIDIWMFREDYNKFYSLFPSFGESKGLYIAGKDTTPYFPRNMLKVCDARTKLIEREYRYQDSFGVFVDIWPLDGTPNGKIKRKIHNALQLNLLRILNAGIPKEEYFKGGLGKRLYREIFNVVGIKRVLNSAVGIFKKYSVTKSIYIENCAETPRGYHYEDFKKRHLSPFEDTEFYVPDGYDRILRNRYGNYMQLPPENQRIPHHIQDVYWL